MVNKLFDKLVHVLRHPYGLFPGAPRGIINCARQWVHESKRTTPVDIRRGPACWYKEFSCEQLTNLPLPKTIETINPNLRCCRIMALERSALFFLRGARVIGEEGTVISPDNRVFAEFTYVDKPGGVETHSIFRRRRFPVPKEISGWYATICYPSSFSYYHWMIESLPRLKLIEAYLDGLDGLLVPKRLEPAMEESLAVFGIGDKKLLRLEMNSHYRFLNLLVPQYCAGLNIPPWVPEFLCNRVLGTLENRATGIKRRIYVSRADASKRRVLNESEIIPILQSYDFEIIRLREFSFIDQARLFNESSVVIGPHGAGLANIAFCRPEVRVLELLPSTSMSPHLYYSLTAATGGIYWYLYGEPDSRNTVGGLQFKNRDFSIESGKLVCAIDALLKT